MSKFKPGEKVKLKKGHIYVSIRDTGVVLQSSTERYNAYNVMVTSSSRYCPKEDREYVLCFDENELQKMSPNTLEKIKALKYSIKVLKKQIEELENE